MVNLNRKDAELVMLTLLSVKIKTPDQLRIYNNIRNALEGKSKTEVL